MQQGPRVSPAVLLVVGVALVGRVAPKLANLFIDRCDHIVREVRAMVVVHHEVVRRVSAAREVGVARAIASLDHHAHRTAVAVQRILDRASVDTPEAEHIDAVPLSLTARIRQQKIVADDALTRQCDELESEPRA